MFFNIKRNIFYSMLHIPALWYFDTPVTCPQWFRRAKFVLIPSRFVQRQYLWNITMQPAVVCYNSWANIQCSGCSPLGEISLWNGIISLLWVNKIGSTLYSEGSFVRRFFSPKPFKVAMVQRTYGPKVLYSEVPLLRKLLCSEDSILRKALHYMDSMLRRFFCPNFI